MLKQINGELQDYESKYINIVPGLMFNQKETLENIIFYYNSKFRTGSVDDEGDRKFFYNINKNPCKVFSKAIDFDTKNIRLLTAGGGDPLKTWFMERDLKYWMRDKQFGKVLNRIFRELPIFGSVVVKIVNGFPYFVDLRNFVVEQSADILDASNYIIEIHNYSVAQFRKVGEEMGWDTAKINQTIEEYRKMKKVSHIRVFERYGEVEEVAEDGKKSYSNRRVFHADVGVDEYDQQGAVKMVHAGVELASQKYEGHPYWEFHAEKIPGRWLGVGVVETLVEPQIAENQQANLQNKTSFWAALRLFFSRDSNLAGNLMTEKRNGEVITGDSEITQIDMSDRNLAFFNDLHRKWMSNRDELTFSYDVVQGERLPAGTPLGSARIAAAQTLSYFEQIQEEIAMDVKEMLYKVVIPRFQEENTKEHTIRLVGQDLDRYIAMVKNELVIQEIIRIASVKGILPTKEEKDAMSIAVEESIKQEQEKILTIPKSFYKDIKYDVDIDITGESMDTRVRYATLFALLQAMTADPTMTQDPIKKKILFKMAEDGGVNPNDLFEVGKGEEMSAMAASMKRAGGGVSAPALAGAISGDVTSTI